MNIQSGNKFFTGLILFLAAAFIIPASVNAFPYGQGQGRHFKGHGRNMGMSCLGIWKNTRIIQDLNLTKAQIDEIKEADFNFREKRLPLRSEIKSLRLEMDKALYNDNLDDNAIISIAKKISKTREKLFLLSVESRLKLRKILSPDQIDKLQTCQRPWRMNGRGQGPGNMPRNF